MGPQPPRLLRAPCSWTLQGVTQLWARGRMGTGSKDWGKPRPRDGNRPWSVQGEGGGECKRSSGQSGLRGSGSEGQAPREVRHMKAGHQPAPRLLESRADGGGEETRSDLHREWTRAAGLWGQPVLCRWTVCFWASPLPGQTADALSRGLVGTGGRRGGHCPCRRGSRPS